MITRPRIALAIGFIVTLLLSACGLVLPSPTPTPLPTATATPMPTETPTPTATSTSLPPLVILLKPSEADPALGSRLETTLHQQITALGLRWQVRPSLTTADLTPELRLVVALPPASNLPGLVAAAPHAQFLAVGIPALEPAPNLTTVSLGDEHPDQYGFIAGVIAAMITPDYRVGMIGISENVPSKAAHQGYLHGVTYFCGLCLPEYPPFYEYPMYVELPAGASSAEWQVAANYMVDHIVKTVYIFPGAGDEATLRTLAEAGINLIGVGTLPEEFRPHWAASLRSDPLPVIQNLLPDLLNGKGAGNLTVPLEIADMNADLFSPGRQRLANEILADLLAGFVGTGVDLLTGENR